MSDHLHAVIAEDIDSILDDDLPWQALSGQTVLVTGAGGFLGTYLTRVLLALHAGGKVTHPVKVIAMVRDVERARRSFGVLVEQQELALLPWDLNAIEVPDIADAAYVIHAASQASPRFYASDPVGTLLPNTVGTAALLEALRRSRHARAMLFISSSEVYGAVTGEVALAECDLGFVDPATVRASYAESKRMGETMCVAWHAQHGVPAFIVRPFHTYGPGLKPEDGRVFADFVFNIVRGENIVMNSDGQARRAFCYVTDAIRGFMRVLLLGTPGVPYNVANPAGELSVAELADLLISLAPDKNLRVERRARSDPGSYAASPLSRLIPDVQRLGELGWRPRVAPEAGFARMLRAHR